MNKGRFEGILLCSDIDNTVLYHDLESKRSYVPEKACKAIKYFQENGGRFTFATGRYPKFAQKELSSFIVPNAPVVALNGSMIYDTQKGEAVFLSPINDDIARLSFDVVERHRAIRRLWLQCSERAYSFDRLPERGYVKYREDVNSSERVTVNSREEFLSSIEGEVVYKILYIVDDEDSQAVKELISSELPEYAIARSWINGIELQNADADKGKSCRRLAELLGDIRLLVCVGVYENDISMVKEADVGYAVKNASEPLKQIADRITGSAVEDGALAEIIDRLEKDIRTAK